MSDSDVSESEVECSAETAGYDGMFGVYCNLPKDHEGLHCDGYVEWRLVRVLGPRGGLIGERHECERRP